MTDTTSLTDLLGRVEGATRANFALDCALFETLAMPTEWFGSKVTGHFRTGADYGFNTEDDYRHFDCLRPPPYTASLDAALSLVERVLPGTGIMLNIGSIKSAHIWPPLPARSQTAEARTPALALLSAMLKALSAIDVGEGTVSS